ncbi:hypothetical protein RHGRI_030188 [Rhododendron griersonianum]|uniref:Uncharacterized protein n=1 Tax=Rhododendron griersonianum TaxID=479676 RepID=A0AAV6ILY3_9ERIC|nr:hypothetical protein RHGRI_030188 [Rhododendron griersonianum]
MTLHSTTEKHIPRAPIPSQHRSATISSTETHSPIGQIILHPHVLLMNVPDYAPGDPKRIRPSDPQAVDPTPDITQHPLLLDHNLHSLLVLEHQIAYQPSDRNRVPVETHVQHPFVHVPLLELRSHRCDDCTPHLGVSLFHEVGVLAAGVDHRLTDSAGVGPEYCGRYVQLPRAEPDSDQREGEGQGVEIRHALTLRESQHADVLECFRIGVLAQVESPARRSSVVAGAERGAVGEFSNLGLGGERQPSEVHSQNTLRVGGVRGAPEDQRRGALGTRKSEFFPDQIPLGQGPVRVEVRGSREKEEEREGSNDVVGGGFLGGIFLLHWIHDSWLPVSRTICWVCGGVPIGRETMRAIEYLNADR